MTDTTPRLWAIILAGGVGARLSSLTRALYGVDLPKQFAVLAGGSSMLQATVDRALALVPAERVLVVVTRPHEELARRQLARWPGVQLVAQPRGLDTGPGLVLPLAIIRARDPRASVVAMPADHHLVRPEKLIDAVGRAAAAAAEVPGALILLGAAADGPDPDYGWIVPGAETDRFDTRAIEAFVEKPAPAAAQALFDRGALWNTFVMIGPSARLWEASRRAMPRHCARLQAVAGRPPGDLDRCLDEAYAELEPVNFSRAVLERAEGLRVMPLRGAGWSDWGTPARVLASLRGSPDHDRLIARMPGSVIASGAA